MFVKCLICALAVLTPTLALAYDVRSAPTGPPVYIEAAELDLGEKNNSWHGRYGAGFALVPEFAGADAYALDLDLDLKLSWKSTFFFENGTLGVIAANNRLWRAGALIRGVQGRRISNLPDLLAGLGKIDTRIDGGLFIGASLYKIYMSGEFFTDISGVTHGQTFNLETGYTMELSRQARLVPYVRLKWGSAQHLQTYFGVTPDQAVATGLRPFQTKASLYESAIGAIFEHDLGNHWRFGSSLNFGLLRGMAKKSPLTKSRFGSPEQVSLRIKLLRTF